MNRRSSVRSSLLALMIVTGCPAAALAQDEDTPWWDQSENEANSTARAVDTSALGDDGNVLPTSTWSARFDSAGDEFYYSIRILGAEAGRAAFSDLAQGGMGARQIFARAILAPRKGYLRFGQAVKQRGCGTAHKFAPGGVGGFRRSPQDHL